MRTAAHSIRIGRVTRGVLANCLGQAINASGQMVLVPVFLAYWGKQLYGEWLTLSAVITYLAIIDFGMQMFVVNRLNQCYVARAFGEHTRVFHSALLMSLLFSGATLLIVAPALLLFPVARWFHFSTTDRATASLVAIVLSIQIVGAVPHGLIAGVYRGIGEYARGQMIANVRSAAAVGLTVLAVAAGGGLPLAAAAQLTALAVTSVYIWQDLRRRHRELDLGIRKAELKLALSFLGPSSLFFLIQLSMALTIQGSTIMVSAVFGAVSAALFVPLRTLSNLVRQAVGALFSALWPEFTALEASGQYESLRRMHLLASKTLVIVSSAAVVFLHFTGREIVAFWTHNRIGYDSRLQDAFLVLLLFQAPWLTASLVLASSNNHRRLALISISSAAAGLALAYLGALRFGMPGLVYGLWAGDFAISGTLIPWIACRMMRQGVAEYVSEVLLRGAALTGLLYFAIGALFGVLPAGLTRLCLIGAVSGVLALAFGYVLYLNRGERTQVRTWIRHSSPVEATASESVG